MACCSLKCLQCMVFTVALVIMVAVGIGPILFGVLYRNEEIVKALDLQTVFLAVTIGTGAVVVIFSFCGLCGACKKEKKSARYCLCWYFLFLVFVIVLVTGLLLLFILINKNGEDNLNEFCTDQTKVYTGLWTQLQKLRTYDDEVKKLGGSGYSLCQSNCHCKVPSGITHLEDGRYRDNHVAKQGSRVNTGPIYVNNSTGASKVSQCKMNKWDDFDGITRSFFTIMGQLENSFDCSGICVTGLLSIAHDSTNPEGSCFSRIIDFSKERWVPAIGLFAGLLAILFFSIVFVCCICYHEELKE